jgi:ribosomal-protein-alanine N-acetyltransferase
MTEMERIVSLGKALGMTSREVQQFTGVHVRWMIRRDMPVVLDIESRAFDSPWEEEFSCCLRQRNCIGMVADVDDQVVGFMVYELHKHFLHLLNFAVDPRVLRCGIGTAMIEKLVGKLSHDRRSRVVCFVRDSNLTAHLFFKAMGFVATRVLKAHWSDGETGDAYRFDYICRECC